MSKQHTPAVFRPEVPGLAYYLPEAPKAAEAAKPEPALTALQQMFDYFS